MFHIVGYYITILCEYPFIIKRFIYYVKSPGKQFSWFLFYLSEMKHSIKVRSILVDIDHVLYSFNPLTDYDSYVKQKLTYPLVKCRGSIFMFQTLFCFM